MALGASFNEVQNLVLVGLIGNGKSATGNSILRKKKFVSKHSSDVVTKISELQSITWNESLILNVIDTPGVLGVSAGNRTVDDSVIDDEMTKCFNMTQGIDAVLFVVSLTKRFSEEEALAVNKLMDLLGEKVFDYMIIVFTHGDFLESNDLILEEYLGINCAKPLKELLHRCEHRWVVFDNKTGDLWKKYQQVDKLLSLVRLISTKMGGKPLMKDVKAEITKEAQTETEKESQAESEVSQAESEKVSQAESEVSQAASKKESLADRQAEEDNGWNIWSMMLLTAALAYILVKSILMN